MTWSSFPSGKYRGGTSTGMLSICLELWPLRAGKPTCDVDHGVEIKGAHSPKARPPSKQERWRLSTTSMALSKTHEELGGTTFDRRPDWSWVSFILSSFLFGASTYDYDMGFGKMPESLLRHITLSPPSFVVKRSWCSCLMM